MDGIIVVNKQAGMTSHDIVDKARKRLKIRRVGHAGTLDPLATGVLILLIGKATKLFDKFVAFDKAYRATLLLGRITDSSDIQGKTIKESPWENITREKIEEAFKRFEGEIEQVPPMVSAVKMSGQTLYKLARKGIHIERQARKIRIDLLKIEELKMPYVRFYVECSKGTYIRQLAEDIGQLLGCGACISQIERVKIGKYNLTQAIKLEDLNESCIRTWED